MSLPNLFIVGTPKSGTTSIFHYLDNHPEVVMCSIKEPNFFSYDQIVEQNLYYTEKGIARKKDYLSLFKGVFNEKIVGEASVSYLYYDKVPGKIKKAVPHAKIIIILRNPIDRALSHYLMDSRLGYVNLSFDDIVYKRTVHPLLALYYQQFIELGFYYGQVQRYLDIFGEEQVKVLLTDDFKEDISFALVSICNFLDIDSDRISDRNKHYNVHRRPRNTIIKHLYAVKSLRDLTKKIIPLSLLDVCKNIVLIQESKPMLLPETRGYLNSLFVGDILQTGNLIDRDLSHWCDE